MGSGSYLLPALHDVDQSGSKIGCFCNISSQKGSTLQGLRVRICVKFIHEMSLELL